MTFQLRHQLSSHLWVAGTHHGNAICPTRPESLYCPMCTSEPQSAKHKGKCGCLAYPNFATLEADTQNFAQAPPQPSVIVGCKLLHCVRHNSEQEIRPCLGTMYQQEPRGLDVFQERDLSQEPLMFLRHVVQVLTNEVGMAERRTKHLDALL